jgi:hypothetical protein
MWELVRTMQDRCTVASAPMVHGHCSSERDGGAQASRWHSGARSPRGAEVRRPVRLIAVGPDSGVEKQGASWSTADDSRGAVELLCGCWQRSCGAWWRHGAGGSGLLVLGTSDDATCGAPGGWIYFLFFRKCSSSAKAQTLDESLKKMLYVRQSAKLRRVPDF